MLMGIRDYEASLVVSSVTRMRAFLSPRMSRLFMSKSPKSWETSNPSGSIPLVSRRIVPRLRKSLIPEIPLGGIEMDE